MQNLEGTLGAFKHLESSVLFGTVKGCKKKKKKMRTGLQRLGSDLVATALPDGSGRCRRTATNAPGPLGSLARLRLGLGVSFSPFQHFEIQFQKDLVVAFLMKPNLSS